MKQFIKEMLNESGTVSSVRFMALACVACASACAFYGLYSGKDLTGVSVLCGVFLSAAFGGKIMQKKFED